MKILILSIYCVLITLSPALFAQKVEIEGLSGELAAGEKAAKTKYKKLAEAYKQLKEDGFGIGLRGMEVNDGGKDRSINEEVDLVNQIASIDWETAIPVLSAVGLLTAGAVSTLKQALKNPKELADRVRKEM
jgi:predicted Zn-dependent peptidase